MRMVSDQLLRTLQKTPAASTARCETASTKRQPTGRAMKAKWPAQRFAGDTAGMLICATFVWIASVPEALAQVVPTQPSAPIVSSPQLQLQIPQIDQPGVPVLPTLPPFNTFPDRVNACIQVGSAAGLSSGSLDDYIAQCADQ